MYTVMLILSFTANQPLVDIVSSYVTDTVVLILDRFFYRVHCKSVEHITGGHITFSINLLNISGFLKCFYHNVFFFLTFCGHPQVLLSSLVCPVQMFLFYCYRCYFII